MIRAWTPESVTGELSTVTRSSQVKAPRTNPWTVLVGVAGLAVVVAALWRLWSSRPPSPVGGLVTSSTWTDSLYRTVILVVSYILSAVILAVVFVLIAKVAFPRAKWPQRTVLGIARGTWRISRWILASVIGFVYGGVRRVRIPTGVGQRDVAASWDLRVNGQTVRWSGQLGSIQVGDHVEAVGRRGLDGSLSAWRLRSGDQTLSQGLGNPQAAAKIVLFLVLVALVIAFG